MLNRVKLLTIATALAVALPGAAAATIAIEDQRSAIMDCKKSRGVGGAAYIEQQKVDPGSARMAARIVPYDRVTYLDADAINACAANRLGLAPAEGRLNSRQRTIVRSLQAPGGHPGMDCGRSPSILYKGNMYCQWARR